MATTTCGCVCSPGSGRSQYDAPAPLRTRRADLRCPRQGPARRTAGDPAARLSRSVARLGSVHPRSPTPGPGAGSGPTRLLPWGASVRRAPLPHRGARRRRPGPRRHRRRRRRSISSATTGAAPSPGTSPRPPWTAPHPDRPFDTAPTCPGEIDAVLHPGVALVVRRVFPDADPRRTCAERRQRRCSRTGVAQQRSPTGRGWGVAGAVARRRRSAVGRARLVPSGRTAVARTRRSHRRAHDVRLEHRRRRSRRGRRAAHRGLGAADYRFEVLDGVSHWIQREVPDVLSELLLEHLDGHEPASTP